MENYTVDLWSFRVISRIQIFGFLCSVNEQEHDGPILDREAPTRGGLWKKAFLEISQNSQKNTYAKVSFLIKLDAWAWNFIKKETLLKKRLWHRCFPVNFAKFLRKPFFIEHLW